MIQSPLGVKCRSFVISKLVGCFAEIFSCPFAKIFSITFCSSNSAFSPLTY
ncbi:MAG: hypothetical protein QXY62_01050 [Candidatus Altiarchaeota archaeon]